MKCIVCGKEMINTIGGCYHCPDCRIGVDDLVNRHYTGKTQQVPQGWKCPKCGSILAPHQYFCPFCVGSITTTITTSPTDGTKLSNVDITCVSTADNIDTNIKAKL